MYAREHRVLLRHYLQQGLSKAEIARSLGVSRRTVYHWIESGQLEREQLRHFPRNVRRLLPCKRRERRARIARFGGDEWSAVASLRLFNQITVCESNGEIWLRGDSYDAQINRALRHLAPRQMYMVHPDGSVVPNGCLSEAEHG